MINDLDIFNYLNELLNKNYKDISNLRIKYEIVKGKGFFMQTLVSLKPYHYFFGYKIEIHKSALKMPVACFIGCLAHELEHISFNESGFLNYYKYDEREIDFNVINKGLGYELLEFMKYHDSRYKKYTEEDGLTKKEIKKLLKILKDN